MGLIKKLLSRRKHKQADATTQNRQTSNNARQNKAEPDFSGASARETTLLRELAREHGEVPIDIALNPVSSETAVDRPQANTSLKNPSGINPHEVDFDFSNLFDNHDDDIPQAEVMAFNPLKTFSQPVDLNLNQLQQKGFITPHTVNTLLGNTFRMIKRPLLNNVMGKGATVLDNANLIMLTSSFSGEGKTFSAINLAISIAMERDKHVLLVDADINKPSHHEVFGYKAEYGLTDLLLGKVKDMSRVLYKTNIPSLTLMPSGRKTSHATELLASEAMEKFVREISSFYKDRVIIFDAPPLLLPTEASVLASHMGQVIVVVEAEKTRRHEVKRSLSMLSNKIVLLLLNQAREKTQIGNYGYYKYEDQT